MTQERSQEASDPRAVRAVDLTSVEQGAVDAPPSPVDPAEIRAQLEALLVVAEGAVPVADFSRALGIDERATAEQLATLADEYAGRGSGIRVRETATGWRLYAAPEHHELIRSAFRDEQPARLTQAALETLAVVAYRQPVSRSRIGAIRGVGADAVVRTLATRGLVVEVGVEDGTGAVLYGTSAAFLEKLGIGSLAELPPLSDHLPDLRDVLSATDVTSM